MINGPCKKNRNKNRLPRRSDCVGGSFLVCPESAVKKDLEKHLTAEDVISKNIEITPDISNFNLHEITFSRITADKTEYFSPLGPERGKHVIAARSGGWVA
jgi:hypothetical protein